MLLWAFGGRDDGGVNLGFLLPAGISVAVASLLTVRGARAVPLRFPLVELAIVIVMLTTLLTFALADGGDDTPSLLVAASMLAWLVLLFTYPDGRFVPSRSVLVFAVGAVGIVASQLLAEGGGVLLVSFAGAFGVGVVSQVFRYRRRSSILERQATKWVMVGLIPAATLFLGIGLVASTTSLGAGALEEDWYFALSSSAIWLVPWCAAIGVLSPTRGRVDPLVYWLVVVCGSTLVLLWAYFLAEPAWGPEMAAAITAALVLPVSSGMRRLARRLVYGGNPGMALAALGESLEQSLQPGDVAGVVARTVVDSLSVPYAAVTLVSGVRHAVGEIDDGAAEQFPVLYAGEQVAWIEVAPRHGELGLAPRDRAVLQRLAISSGTALHAAATLQRLQAARENLVMAREEERRRLRRELHDDLAPTLVALGFTAASASAVLERDVGRARQLLDGLQESISVAVERVREIAYDLRPPVLDDIGLMAALGDRLGTDDPGPPRVEVRGHLDEERVPAAVQLAALRIAQEAVTNVRRHAGASTCCVEITEEAEQLVLRVSDDGRGVRSGVRRGVGSRSMEEQAAELGGEVALVTSPGGTTVEARLPLVGTLS